MYEFLFQRIKNNILLYLFLLVGCVLTVAIFSSIPMYSNGILQEVLTKNMEALQVNTSEYPNHMFFKWIDDSNTNNEISKDLEEVIHKDLLFEKEEDVLEVTRVQKSSPFRITPSEGNFNSIRSRFFNVNGFADHFQIIRGRFPDNEGYFNGEKDYLEIALTKEALLNLDLLYEKLHTLELNKEPFMKVMVVGLVEEKDKSEIYFDYNFFSSLNYGFLLEDRSFEKVISDNETISIEEINWSYYINYKDIEVKELDQLIRNNEQRRAWINTHDLPLTLEYSFVDIFKDFKDNEKTLETILWILTIPVLLLTVFYIFMISSLIMKNDGLEIAVLKSRGAGTIQIFSMYVVQSIVVGAMAFLVGPYLGKVICLVIGSSNGFLEFVQRDSLPIEMTLKVRLFAAFAVLLFLVFTLIPAFLASKTSIVQFKRSKNENKSKTIWEKGYFDIILLGIAAYGYFTLSKSKGDLSLITIEKGNIDPLLFLVSTLFIIGINLFALRLFPYIVRFFFWATKKYLSPVMYFSLLNVARADHNLRFIMLFIMLSISFGILGSSQARTFNQNAMDQVNYFAGADVVISPYEIKEDQEVANIYAGITQAYATPTGLKEIKLDKTPYKEYQQLESAQKVTKFLSVEDAALRHGRSNISHMEVYGIIPYEYAEIGWFREDLTNYHLNEYMNILTKVPNAVFLSENLKKDYKINIGDEVGLMWENNIISCIVYGYIPVFPTYQPYVEKENDDNDNDEAIMVEQFFAVMNYQYIEQKVSTQNYDIWIKKKPQVTDQMVQDELISKKLEANQVTYSGQGLIEAKNNPILQGTNGVLTMCFVITMGITIIGYLIFWMITMKSRALKFGIFRAMGMTMNQVTRIILTEQLLMTGSAILIGFILGIVASRLFVPLLQLLNKDYLVPPFIVVLDKNDYLRILAIAFGMLSFGMFVLFGNIRRLKLNQVIKLGED